MAKKKTRPQGTSQTNGESPDRSDLPEENVVLRTSPKLSAGQYVVLNAVFIAFCIVQLLIVKLFIHDTRGMYFFFGLLIAGMALVSVFDFLFDRMNKPPAETPES